MAQVAIQQAALLAKNIQKIAEGATDSQLKPFRYKNLGSMATIGRHNAVDAYERGNVPLNTLANAVLQKYDENNALASRNYELHHQEENVEQQRGLK